MNTAPIFAELEAHFRERDERIAREQGIPVEFVTMNRAFEHTLTRDKYEAAMAARAVLERDPERVAGRPAAGDIVVAKGPGVVYASAHLQLPHWDGEDFSVCMQAGEPHVSAKGHVSASGGYWRGCKRAELRPTGEVRGKRFWTWGDFPGAGRGVTFTLPVRVWTLENPNIY